MPLDIATKDPYEQRIADLDMKIKETTVALQAALASKDTIEVNGLETKRNVLQAELNQVRANAEAAAGYTDGDPDDTLGEVGRRARS